MSSTAAHSPDSASAEEQRVVVVVDSQSADYSAFLPANTIMTAFYIKVAWVNIGSSEVQLFSMENISKRRLKIRKLNVNKRFAMKNKENERKCKNARDHKPLSGEFIEIKINLSGIRLKV